MMLDGNERQRLLQQHAASYTETARATITREYPVAVIYTARGSDDRFTQRQLHPVFYGSFDWHSCVEMHWALWCLIHRFPDLPHAAEYRATLDALYTAEHLQQEADFLAANRLFERPYGWGWFLTLFHELVVADNDIDAPRWASAMGPMATAIEAALLDWLPVLAWPVRHGVHANTAFALARSMPYARHRASRGDPRLSDAIVSCARRWFLDDRDYPIQYEPSGNDFLSPALTEAELMADVLAPAEFTAWLDGFLPGLAHEEPAAFFQSVVVSNDTDGQIAHLHGLNLSRARGWRRIAEALPAGDPRIAIALSAAGRHATAGLPFVSGSNYMVEHWLAAYAVLLLGEG